MARTIQIGKTAVGIQPGSRLNKNAISSSTPGLYERKSLVTGTVTPDILKTALTNSVNGDLTDLNEIYDKMETDIEFGGLINQVERTLAGATLKVEKKEGRTASENKLAEDYLLIAKEVIANIKTRPVIKDFVRAFMRGTRIFQPVYSIEQYGSKYLAIPTSIKEVSGQRYMWEREQGNERWGELKVKTSEVPSGVYVDDMPAGSIFTLSDGYQPGRWDLKGVYRRVASWWLLKLYAANWWSDNVELFGEPFRIARYPQGTRNSVKNEVESFLANMGRTAYVLLPENINLQLLESAASSSNGGLSTHHELVRYIDNRMAFTVLGQADTGSDTRAGSYARTEGLIGITWDMLKDYAGGVSEGFEELFCATYKRNYGEVNKRLVPKASLLIINPEIAQANTNKFTSLTSSGLAITLDEMYEQTGTTRPSNGTIVFVNGQVVEYDESAYQRQGEESRSNDQQESSDEEGEGTDS